MDLSLKQIIEKSDDIHKHIELITSSLGYTKLTNYLIDLENMLKEVSSVALKVSNIYSICNNKYKSTTGTYGSTIKKTITSKTDWVYLNRTITNSSTSKLLTHDIPINVKIVKDIDEVPNIPLYWVSSINQYVMHINGVILRGNIGNIYNKSSIKKNKIINQITICKNGNTCRNVLGSEICKFYHDPVDLLKLVKSKTISVSIFNKYKNLHRNFLNTSWIYTEQPRNKNNSLMRHFGSRNTLKHEFDLIKLNNLKASEININNFMQQCMHDILIIMGLNQYGLLNECPDLYMRKQHHDNLIIPKSPEF
jgi:hypothetical protein